MEEESGRIGHTDGEFAVVQFFVNERYEYVRRYVSGKEAVEAFSHYIQSIAAAKGIVARVIITDGDDCVNMEWLYGCGIVFPGEPVFGKSPKRAPG